MRWYSKPTSCLAGTVRGMRSASASRAQVLVKRMHPVIRRAHLFCSASIFFTDGAQWDPKTAPPVVEEGTDVPYVGCLDGASVADVRLAS